MHSSSIFQPLRSPVKHPIFDSHKEYLSDTNPQKINLALGIYQDTEGKPSIAPSIAKAQTKLFEEGLPDQYVGIEGDVTFINEIKQLIFKSSDKSIFGMQTVGGTAALRFLFTFIKKAFERPILTPNSSWSHYAHILQSAQMQWIDYPYLDLNTRELKFDQMHDFLLNAEEGSFVLLQTSCHNPSGRDLSCEQWQKLGKVCVEKRLIPIFDTAYQGYGKGLDEDVFAIRHFHSLGLEMFVTYSLERAFDLFHEKVGALFVLNQSDSHQNLSAHLEKIARTFYLNPPVHGAKIIRTVLQDEQIRKEWEKELSSRRLRLQGTRELLAVKLQSLVDVDPIRKGLGFFTLLGINEQQVGLLKKDGIHMIRDSRINLFGLNERNMDHFVASLEKVL